MKAIAILLLITSSLNAQRYYLRTPLKWEDGLKFNYSTTAPWTISPWNDGVDFAFQYGIVVGWPSTAMRAHEDITDDEKEEIAELEPALTKLSHARIWRKLQAQSVSHLRKFFTEEERRKLLGPYTPVDLPWPRPRWA